MEFTAAMAATCVLGVSVLLWPCVTVGVTSAAEATEAAITITNFIVSLLLRSDAMAGFGEFEGTVPPRRICGGR